jgi:hypothetical protein
VVVNNTSTVMGFEKLNLYLDLKPDTVVIVEGGTPVGMSWIQKYVNTWSDLQSTVCDNIASNSISRLQCRLPLLRDQRVVTYNLCQYEGFLSQPPFAPTINSFTVHYTMNIALSKKDVIASMLPQNEWYSATKENND